MCPCKTSTEYLEQRARDKTSKYKPFLNELSQVNSHSGEFVSLVFCLLGTITNSTNKNLKKRKLSKYKEALQIMATKGAINILHNHFRSNDFERKATLRGSLMSKCRYTNYDDHYGMTNGQSGQQDKSLHHRKKK